VEILLYTKEFKARIKINKTTKLFLLNIFFEDSLRRGAKRRGAIPWTVVLVC
jgi:hypothetical protein